MHHKGIEQKKWLLPQHDFHKFPLNKVWQKLWIGDVSMLHNAGYCHFFPLTSQVFFSLPRLMLSSDYLRQYFSFSEWSLSVYNKLCWWSVQAALHYLISSGSWHKPCFTTFVLERGGDWGAFRWRHCSIHREIMCSPVALETNKPRWSNTPSKSWLPNIKHLPLALVISVSAKRKNSVL